MNAYMLGGESDDMIKFELIDKNGASDKGFTDWFIGTAADGKLYGGAANSFSTGSIDGRVISAGEMAAGKANAAGYTCAREGCHNSSMFAVNKWGFAAQRSDNATASVTGHRTNPGSGYFIPTSATGGRPKDNTLCGPCHPGNPAGGYRAAATSAPGEFIGTSDRKPQRAKAFGCDQCHDAVGVKTGTTAWPHGNSGIQVFEWETSQTNTMGAPVLTNTTGGNLWMYQGNVAGFGELVEEKIFDTQFTLVAGAVGDDGVIRDGVCLKCHVPIDGASINALNVYAGGGKVAYATALANAEAHLETLIPQMLDQFAVPIAMGFMTEAQVIQMAKDLVYAPLAGINRLGAAVDMYDLRAGYHTVFDSDIAHGGAGDWIKDNKVPNLGFALANQYEPEGMGQSHLIWTYR
jgi:hypothetical protein